MKIEFANEIVSLINGKYAGTLKAILKYNLEYEGELVTWVKPYGSHANDVYVRMSGPATAMVTGNKLLRQMFKDATLVIDLGITEDTEAEERVIAGWVRIEYDHSFRPGSNGTDLMRFSICLDDGTIYKWV